MLWTNYHCHTQYCDGRADAKDFVKAAVRANLNKLGFSSHSPVPYHSDWNMKASDMPLYINEVLYLKEKYCHQIEILLGMEVDFIPGIFGPQSKEIKVLPTDYLIASVHYLDYFDDGTPWSVDGPVEWFDLGIRQIFNGDIRKFAKRFTAISREMIEHNGFDIVGHIDKMYQHGSRYHDVGEKWYRGLVGELLEAAGQQDLIVEINTKSYRKLGFFYPHQSFFKLLKDLNIRITINSDTHDPEKIDLAFNEAADALTQAGISTVFEFIDGEWTDCKLTKKGVLV
ncbi:histidinol-phosphatase [Saccharicrinis sp. FJH54]|uniref:histidinol-phosphatase n=1 Tax=Saccharicrinis sp. FJH54 TaxID=3344665 RepID=UPI0035D420DD